MQLRGRYGKETRRWESFRGSGVRSWSTGVRGWWAYFPPFLPSLPPSHTHSELLLFPPNISCWFFSLFRMTERYYLMLRRMDKTLHQSMSLRKTSRRPTSPDGMSIIWFVCHLSLTILSPRWNLHSLWSRLTAAIVAKDMEAATEAKTAVEESQRELRRHREESGQKHVPRFFAMKGGRWIPKFTYVSLLLTSKKLTDECSYACSMNRPPNETEEAVQAVQQWIWSSPSTLPSWTSSWRVYFPFVARSLHLFSAFGFISSYSPTPLWYLFHTLAYHHNFTKWARLHMARTNTVFLHFCVSCFTSLLRSFSLLKLFIIAQDIQWYPHVLRIEVSFSITPPFYSFWSLFGVECHWVLVHRGENVRRTGRWWGCVVDGLFGTGREECSLC